MKAWHIAAAVVGLAVLYILVKRPTLPAVGQGTQSGGNDLFRSIGSLANLGTAIVGKIGAPSAVDSDATYKPGQSFEDYTTSLFGPGTAG